MSDGPDIQTPEVRAMLRLANELHGIPESLQRRQSLLSGLCRLVGACDGTSVITRLEQSPGEPMVVSVVGDDSAHRPPQGRFDDRSDRSPSISSTVHIDGRDASATVRLFRERQTFLPYQERLVEVFHQEMRWIYRSQPPAAPLPPPSELGLSPRMQQVLDLQLHGFSLKQIARQLAVSQHTAHTYVKAIYARFHVSSRAELMALWVARAVPPAHPPPPTGEPSRQSLMP